MAGPGSRLRTLLVQAGVLREPAAPPQVWTRGTQPSTEPPPSQDALAAAQEARSRLIQQVAAAGGDLTPLLTQAQPLQPGEEPRAQLNERINREGWTDASSSASAPGGDRLAALRTALARAAALRAPRPAVSPEP